MKSENLEVIMRIDFSATDGTQIVAHAEKVQVLVRCGECKWWRKDSDHTCRLLGGASPRLVKDFCSRGERKGEEDGDNC